MIIDKYTKHSIFSLPLIFYNTFTKIDLKLSDFVNMYTCDLNKPMLNNHIFLVFHNIQKNLLDKLRKHHLYTCNYHFTIEKTDYTAIVFERAYTIYSIVHRIEHGLYYNLLYEDKLKILNFWEANCNSNIHKYLFNENIIKVKPICENITKYT